MNDPDLWVIWADGTMAQLSEVNAGEFDFMSDDYRPATEVEISLYLETIDNPNYDLDFFSEITESVVDKRIP